MPPFWLAMGKVLAGVIPLVMLLQVGIYSRNTGKLRTELWNVSSTNLDVSSFKDFHSKMTSPSRTCHNCYLKNALVLSFTHTCPHSSCIDVDILIYRTVLHYDTLAHYNILHCTFILLESLGVIRAPSF